MNECLICGKKLGSLTAYFHSFQGYNICLCSKCSKAISKSKSRNNTKSLEYLNNKLYNAPLNPGAIVYLKYYLGEDSTDEELEDAKEVFLMHDKNSGTRFSIRIWMLLGLCFFVSGIILYNISVDNDYGVANIQSTVFSAASFVAGVVCFVGDSIINTLKS